MALRFIAGGRSRTSWPAGRPRGCNWSNCPSLRPGSQPRRGGMEAPQVRGVEEPLLPEPLRVEGRITQGQGALETQKRCHPRLHKAARIRGLGVCAEISKGSLFEDRVELHAAGVHRNLQAGIAGSQTEGAELIVLSGGYEVDQ